MSPSPNSFPDGDDYRAIVSLEAAYARTYDSILGKEWAELFTEDGVYQTRPAPGIDPNFVHGRAQLAKFCDSQPFSGMHTMHIPEITVRGDDATVVSHFNYDAHGVDRGVSLRRRVTGRYDTRYVRSSSCWKISRRVTSIFMLERHSLFTYPSEAPDLTDLPAASGSYGHYADGRS